LPASAVAALLLVTACGYRFSGTPSENPYPPDLKTIAIESAVNNTTVTGIEAELTNDLRQEFALDTRLKPVRSGGDVILKTNISVYEDTPSTYRADGKELTRMGTLRVACSLERTDSKKGLWRKDLSQSYPYNVTDTIGGTLANRRQAISRMIKDLIPRIHRSMYDNF
jgi:outer membrane lipopolysaccharide assembly protein LptE/RlpB